MTAAPRRGEAQLVQFKARRTLHLKPNSALSFCGGISSSTSRRSRPASCLVFFLDFALRDMKNEGCSFNLRFSAATRVPRALARVFRSRYRSNILNRVEVSRAVRPIYITYYKNIDFSFHHMDVEEFTLSPLNSNIVDFAHFAVTAQSPHTEVREKQREPRHAETRHKVKAEQG